MVTLLVLNRALSGHNKGCETLLRAILLGQNRRQKTLTHLPEFQLLAEVLKAFHSLFGVFLILPIIDRTWFTRTLAECVFDFVNYPNLASQRLRKFCIISFLVRPSNHNGSLTLNAVMGRPFLSNMPKWMPQSTPEAISCILHLHPSFPFFFISSSGLS